MEPPRISARPLAFLIRDVGLTDAASGSVLAGHGLSADDLRRDATDIPLRAFVGVMEDLDHIATAPLLAWQAGERFDLTELGAFGLGLSLAPTLGDALRFFERTFCTVQTGTRTRMTVEDGEVSFHYAILDPQIWPRRQDADLTLGLIAGLVRRFCGPEPVPLALGFEHARGPDSAALSARVRHEVAHAEETNRIAFPARLLDATGEGRGTADFATVSRELDRVARDRHRTQTLRTRVKQAVLEDMGHGPVDQTRIARALGLSRRSLRRRLEANGDSFRHLVDECRQSCALAYLTRTDWPISAIAFRLGYSDQTAFSRAFSRWYGRSPRAVRMDARERGVSGRCP